MGRMRSLRIVEVAFATGLAAVSAVVAFLVVPLDLASRERTLVAGHAGAQTSAEVQLPLPAPPRPMMELRPTTPRRSRPNDALFSNAPPAGADPYRDPGPDDLRLSPIATCRGSCEDEASGSPCRTPGHGITVRREVALLDSEPDQARTGDVLFLLGAEAQAHADYAAAADYYEAFAAGQPDGASLACSGADRESGGCPDAARALENAILFRRSLGQNERALEDAALFEVRYGDTRVADAARVSMHAGAIHRTAHGLADAVAHYDQHVRRYERHVSPGAAIRALVALGRARWDAGDRRRATSAFRRALVSWQRGDASAVATQPDDDAEPDGAEFARTLEAVAEAGFHLAEVRYDRYRGMAAPRYEGDGSAADVERWVARELGPWVRRKGRALAVARDAFDEVQRLGVTRWQIAAASRTGRLYLDLARDLRNVRPPAEVRGAGELVDAVAIANPLEPAIRRLEGPAVQALEHCMALARSSRQFGAWSLACAEGLIELAPDRHPPDVELRPTRALSHDELRLPAPIERDLAGEGRCASET